MKRLHDEKRLGFALVWIGIYVMGSGLADGLSEWLGQAKSATFLFHAGLSIFALVWLRRNGLMREYGLHRSGVPSARFGYYIPLAILTSCNLWYGWEMNFPPLETSLYIGSMIGVGFLEELIFRGFLFRALERDGVRTAIAVSSITFGLGHIVNLFNGSGAGIVSNLCQIGSAVAFGFLFVILFHRGQSLLPCIAAHSAINALSAFGNEAAMTGWTEVLTSLALCIGAAGYALVLSRTLPAPDDGAE